ncbi:hypothetical protein AX16_003056 [Volvariella volvacea WC 439]|nr:hypothetical protein AX16_003056 [Volvariella volvacea WC 439]
MLPSRPHTLHTSALNPAEYQVYLSALADLTDSKLHDLNDHMLQAVQISIREAKVARFFGIADLYTSTLSASQFLPIIRMIFNYESHGFLSDDMVFVQANPRCFIPSELSLKQEPCPPSTSVLADAEMSTEDHVKYEAEFSSATYHPPEDNVPEKADTLSTSCLLDNLTRNMARDFPRWENQSTIQHLISTSVAESDMELVPPPPLPQQQEPAIRKRQKEAKRRTTSKTHSRPSVSVCMPVRIPQLHFQYAIVVFIHANPYIH